MYQLPKYTTTRILIILIILIILCTYYCDINNVDTHDEINNDQYNKELYTSIGNARSEILFYPNNFEMKDTLEYEVLLNVIHGNQSKKNAMIISMLGTNDDMYDLIDHLRTIEHSYDNIYINKIWNNEKFTNNNKLLFERYDSYRKYFKIPYNADDYDKPLLDNDNTDYPKSLEDIEYESPIKFYRQSIINNIFIHDIYDNFTNEYFRYNDIPLIFRYFLIVNMTDIPSYVFTEDAIVIDNNTNSILLSEIMENINIDWTYIRERVITKMKNMAELMIMESHGERIISGIQEILNTCNIYTYQFFGVDIIMKNEEPYVYQIVDSPKSYKSHSTSQLKKYYSNLTIQTANILEIL